MPGPPPKHPSERRRRNATPGFTQLPPAGREGEPPMAWPISKATDEELALWESVWHLPQAAEWERLGWFRVVARYVRTVLRAEEHGASAADRGEVRQLEDRLGLSPMAMLRLRWEIAEAEVEAKPAAKADVRRLRAVDPTLVKAAGE